MTRRRDLDVVPGLRLVQWLLAALSLVIVAGTIGFLVWQGAAVRNGPPLLTVRADRTIPQEGGWLVEFTAANRGGAAAAQVRVEGRLEAGARPAESSSVVLDYVPAKSERRGGLYFSSDPGQDRLSLRIHGYAEP